MSEDVVGTAVGVEEDARIFTRPLEHRRGGGEVAERSANAGPDREADVLVRRTHAAVRTACGEGHENAPVWQGIVVGVGDSFAEVPGVRAAVDDDA